MSLDLYIKSKIPVKHRGTGVFIRRNGQTVELETLEEVKQYFPNTDMSSVNAYEKEDNTVWQGNATHNLTEMAEHVIIGDYNFYQLLWHPEENGFEVITEEYKQLVYKGFAYMLAHRKELEKYNPDNGWGSYDTFLHFVQGFTEALSKLDNEEYTIYSWT